MRTVKAEDVLGRVKTYEASVKGEDVIQPGVPESFHVLLKELQGLGLSVELLNEPTNKYEIKEGDVPAPAISEIDNSIWSEMALGEGMQDLDLGDDDDDDILVSDDILTKDKPEGEADYASDDFSG